MSKFQNCVQYNGRSEQDQLAQLRASLTDTAANCLCDFGFENCQSLDKLISLLRSRFGAEGQSEKFRSELRARRRHPNESLQTLYQDVKRLLNLAYPGPSNPIVEIVGRDAYLDALCDSALALRIREKDAMSMEDALRIALRLEAYAKADRTSVGDDQTRPSHRVRGTIDTKEGETSYQITQQLQAMRSELRGEINRIGQRLSHIESQEIVTTQQPITPWMENLASPSQQQQQREAYGRRYRPRSIPIQNNQSAATANVASHPS